MRIAYVLARPELCGGNKVAIQHARLLADLGHEVVVLGEGAAPDWIRLGVPYVDDAAPGFESARAGLRGQDLVIATFWPTIALAERLDLGPVAHLCQGYEGDLRHLRPRLAEIEAAYARPLPALVVSPHLGELLRARFGRESRVAPPPLDPAFAPARRNRPAREPWVAIPGIFEAEIKDVATALQAVRLLRGRQVPARVLRFATLPLSAEERALLEPDRYLCAVPPEEVARSLAECDLLLLPSRCAEGFGLPALEAMAAGVPVVASSIPSLRWFAAGAAVLVEEGNPEAFAEAAGRLLSHPAQWRRARRQGLRRAQDFRSEVVAGQLDAAVDWARQAAASRRQGAAVPR